MIWFGCSVGGKNYKNCVSHGKLKRYFYYWWWQNLKENWWWHWLKKLSEEEIQFSKAMIVCSSQWIFYWIEFVIHSFDLV